MRPSFTSVMHLNFIIFLDNPYVISINKEVSPSGHYKTDLHKQAIFFIYLHHSFSFSFSVSTIEQNTS